MSGDLNHSIGVSITLATQSYAVMLLVKRLQSTFVLQHETIAFP